MSKTVECIEDRPLGPLVDAQLDYFHALFSHIETHKAGRLAELNAQPIPIDRLRKAGTKSAAQEMFEQTYYNEMASQLDLEKLARLVEKLVPPQSVVFAPEVLAPDAKTKMPAHRRIIQLERLRQREVIYAVGAIVSYFCGEHGEITVNAQNHDFFVNRGLGQYDDSPEDPSKSQFRPTEEGYAMQAEPYSFLFPTKPWIELDEQIMSDYIATGLAKDEMEAVKLFEQRDEAIEGMIVELEKGTPETKKRTESYS